MKNQRLYTILLEYMGGTYISQVRAGSVWTAVVRWADNLRDEDLVHWGLSRADMTKLCEDEYRPTPLEGCVNGWCLTGYTGKAIMLINIFATDERQETQQLG